MHGKWAMAGSDSFAHRDAGFGCHSAVDRLTIFRLPRLTAEEDRTKMNKQICLLSAELRPRARADRSARQFCKNAKDRCFYDRTLAAKER